MTASLAPDNDVDPDFFEDVVISFPERLVISSAPWKSDFKENMDKEKAEAETASNAREDSTSQDSFFDSNIPFERVDQEKEKTEATAASNAGQMNQEKSDTQDSFYASNVVFEQVDKFVELAGPFEAPALLANMVDENVECSQCGVEFTRSQQRLFETQAEDEPMEEETTDSALSQLLRIPGSSSAETSNRYSELNTAMFNGNHLGMDFCDPCMDKNLKHKVHKNPAQFHRKTLFWCDDCALENAKKASLRDSEEAKKKRKAEDEGERSRKRKK